MMRFLLTKCSHPASESLISERMHAGRSLTGRHMPVCIGYVSSLCCVRTGAACRSCSSKGQGGGRDNGSPRSPVMFQAFAYRHDGSRTDETNARGGANGRLPASFVLE